MLDQRVAVGVHLETAHVDETALGVTANRMLDLDDVSTPVRQDCPCGGHERELGNLEDTDALHHLGQLNPLP